MKHVKREKVNRSDSRRGSRRTTGSPSRYNLVSPPPRNFPREFFEIFSPIPIGFHFVRVVGTAQSEFSIFTVHVNWKSITAF